MNKLWDTRKYMPEKLNRTINYSGLRIDIHPHVHPFICRELRIFCRWLRASYDFPVRVHIYVPNAKRFLRVIESCVMEPASFQMILMITLAFILRVDIKMLARFKICKLHMDNLDNSGT